MASSYVILENSEESSADTQYTIYVSASGSDSSSGDRGSPKATIAGALSKAPASDGSTTYNIILLSSGAESDSLRIDNSHGNVNVNISSTSSVSWAVVCDQSIVIASGGDHQVKMTVGGKIALTLRENSAGSVEDHSEKMSITVSNGATMKVVTGPDVEWDMNLDAYGTVTFSSTDADGIVTISGNRSIKSYGKIDVENDLILGADLMLMPSGSMSLGKVLIDLTQDYQPKEWSWEGHLIIGNSSLEFTDIIATELDSLQFINGFWMYMKSTEFWVGDDPGELKYVGYAGDSPTVLISDLKDIPTRKWWYQEYDFDRVGMIGAFPKVIESYSVGSLYSIYIKVDEGFENIRINGVEAKKNECNIRLQLLSKKSSRRR